MAIITELSDCMPALLPMQGRSDCVHVSNVIQYLWGERKAVRARSEAARSARSAIRVDDDTDRSRFQAMMELGNAWEWAVVERYHRHAPTRYLQCGELTVDGLAGTPDLLDMELEAVHEFKATWMSLRTATPGSDKFWKYEMQQKAYCYMLAHGVEFSSWTTSVLEVAYVNGTYEFGSPDGPVKYRKWMYEWTADELVAAWRTLTQHAHLVPVHARG